MQNSGKKVARADRPPRFIGGLSVLLALICCSACQTPAQRIASREDNLVAAGFVVRPADTAERRQLLEQLPAHKFVRRSKEDTVHYVYADPTVCKCLYVGTQDAYRKYVQDRQSAQQIKELEKDLKARNNAAEDDDFNEQIYSGPYYNWEAWGPWGP